MAKDIFIYIIYIYTSRAFPPFFFFPRRSSPCTIPVTGQRSRSSFASARRRVISSRVFFFFFFFFFYFKLLYIYFFPNFPPGPSSCSVTLARRRRVPFFSLIFPFAQQSRQAAARVSFLPRNAFKSPCGIQFLNRGE